MRPTFSQPLRVYTPPLASAPAKALALDAPRWNAPRPAEASARPGFPGAANLRSGQEQAPRWTSTPPVQTPEPLRVVIREDPAPGDPTHIGEAKFEDARSLAAARRSRIGGYLKMPFEAVRALGKKVILLDKIVEGTDLILRVRLYPVPGR